MKETRKKIYGGVYWVLLLGTIVGFLAFQAATFVRNIPRGVYRSKIVFITPGSHLKQIARQLAEEQVVRSWKFKLLARLMRKQGSLQPGEYRFDVPTPPLKVIQILVEGRVILHKVTLPEGVTTVDVTNILANQGLVDTKSFQNLLQDKEAIQQLEIPSTSFEGFLFPDTYHFSKTEGERKILQVLVARFRRAIKPEYQIRAKELNLSLLEWITLASIIEKESSLSAEHPIISSVFHNRLKKNMRLQSDPTVIYGIDNFDGNVKKIHLQTPTPFNTYTRKGLPPTPIASPGESAIRAAVSPEKTDYLYFVAKKDGTHAFSKTYEQHQKYVAKYQLNRKSKSQNYKNK